MNKATKTSIWITTGVVGVSSVGVAIFYAIKYFTRYQRIDLGTQYEYNGKNVAGGGVDLVWYANENGTQFMTKEEYKQLDEYIATHLYYGPEVDSLFRIVFGDRNVIGGNEAGLYFPISREIFINTEMYIGISKNATFEQKRDSVFEVIAHEYGHHFAHTYMKDYKAKEGVDTTTMTPYENQLGSVWNKEYLDGFTNAVGLTGTSGNIKDEKSRMRSVNGKESYNINGTASLNQLYKYSNDKNYGSPLDSSKNYYFGTSEAGFPAYDMPLVEGEDDIKSLKYFYSTDEQYTRLMEQMMLPKDYNKDGVTFMPRSVIGSARSLWGTVAYDTAHSRSLSPFTANTHNLIYPSNVFGGVMNDGKDTPISNNSKKLYGNYLGSMGFGAQLANLYSQNDRYIIGKTSNGSYEYSHGTVDEVKNIKLSGYTANDWDYIAIYDSKNKKVVQNLSITSKDIESQNEVFNFFGRNNRNTTYDNTSGSDLHKDFLKPGSNPDPNDPSNHQVLPPKSNLNPEYGYKKFSYISNQFVNFEQFQGEDYQIWFNNKSNITPGDIPSTGNGDDTNVLKLTEIFNNGVTNYEEGLDPNAHYYYMTLGPNKDKFTVKNNY